MKPVRLLTIIVVVLLGACSFKEDKISARNGEITTIKPAMWMPLQLNQAADIQIGNPVKEAYFMTIIEPRSDYREGFTYQEYSEITRGIIKGNANKFEQQADASLTKVGGMPAVKYVIHAEVDNTRIKYWHICVGGKKYFHQLVLWSLPSKFDGNKAAFERIIKAYREHSAELDTPTRGE